VLFHAQYLGEQSVNIRSTFLDPKLFYTPDKQNFPKNHQNDGFLGSFSGKSLVVPVNTSEQSAEKKQPRKSFFLSGQLFFLSVG